jgi:CheY-like chemotaxis protein
MDNRILVVIHDREMRNYVCELLDEYFEEQRTSNFVVDTAKNVKEARKRTDGTAYRAIVIHLHLAKDRKSALVEEDMLGLDFLRRFKENGNQTPSIFLTPVGTNELLSKINVLTFTSPLIIGEEDWEDKIIEEVQRAIKTRMASGSPINETPQLPKKATGKVNLDIFVDDQKKNWMMVANGVGDIICDNTPHVVSFNIDLKRVKVADEAIYKLREDHPHWEQGLQEIGKDLVEEIMKNDPETMRFYETLKGQAGGSENFKICFSMDENNFALPVEAILEPDFQELDDFWMLKAPICRRVMKVKPQEYRWPLFEDERQGAEHQPINCLIIEADVDGYNEKIDDELKHLVNVKTEANVLKELLLKNQAAFNIDQIKRLPDKDDPCTSAKVEEILTSGQRWDLVHYAGHSYHNDNGYVFFPDTPTFQEVEIEKFALWLRDAKTRLIYLSSCESSKVKFVHKLAKTGVPSVLGFRWDIDDQKAAEHAEIFYEQLFAERSLEYAFLKTRQKVHENNPEHIIWAAPVLVMQARR